MSVGRDSQIQLRAFQFCNAGNLAIRSTHMHTSSYAVMSTTDSRLPLLSPRTPYYDTEPSVGTK